MFGHDPRLYTTTVKEFKMNKKGEVCKAVLVSLESKKDEKTGRMAMVPVAGSEKEVPADLVLIAAGFLGSESYVTDAFGVKVNERTNVATNPDSFETNVKRCLYSRRYAPRSVPGGMGNPRRKRCSQRSR